MSYEYEEIVNVLRNEVKNKANEVSHRLHDDEIYQIRETLKFIDELEDRMNEFDDIISGAWEDCVMF